MRDKVCGWQTMSCERKIQKVEEFSLRSIASELARQRRALSGLPRSQRSWLVRQRFQFLMYAWWHQLHGRPVARPLCAGSRVCVTKQIPGICLPLFRWRLWILVPTVLEYGPVLSSPTDKPQHQTGE